MEHMGKWALANVPLFNFRSSLIRVHPESCASRSRVLRFWSNTRLQTFVPQVWIPQGHVALNWLKSTSMLGYWYMSEVLANVQSLASNPPYSSEHVWLYVYVVGSTDFATVFQTYVLISCSSWRPTGLTAWEIRLVCMKFVCQYAKLYITRRCIQTNTTATTNSTCSCREQFQLRTPSSKENMKIRNIISMYIWCGDVNSCDSLHNTSISSYILLLRLHEAPHTIPDK